MSANYMQTMFSSDVEGGPWTKCHNWSDDNPLGPAGAEVFEVGEPIHLAREGWGSPMFAVDELSQLIFYVVEFEDNRNGRVAVVGTTRGNASLHVKVEYLRKVKGVLRLAAEAADDSPSA